MELQMRKSGTGIDCSCHVLLLTESAALAPETSEYFADQTKGHHGVTL